MTRLIAPIFYNLQYTIYNLQFTSPLLLGVQSQFFIFDPFAPIMKNILTVSSLFLCCVLMAQSYTPIDTNDHALRKVKAIELQANSTTFQEHLKNKYPGKIGKELAKDYSEFADGLQKSLEEGSFLLGTPFSSYIEALVSRLQASNPNLPKELKILISKDPSLNAYCLIDGTFIINLGVFHWLDNEPQIASILSHEAAHNVLEHSLKRLVKDMEFRKSKEYKSQLAQIKASKYNKSQMAFQFLKGMMYQRGADNKKVEFEADSLGYVFFKKSGFPIGHYPKALELMVYYDTLKPKGLDPKIYSTWFDLPGQPFKEKWLEMENFDQYQYDLFEEKIDRQAVASHPEGQERVSYLKNRFPEIDSAAVEEPAMSEELKNLQRMAAMEIIPQMLYREDYGVALYATLLRLQREKDLDYFQPWLGICFQKIYEARKSYTLNRHLDRVNPSSQSQSYQQFLNFIWNLKIGEIEHIYRHYTGS